MRLPLILLPSCLLVLAWPEATAQTCDPVEGSTCSCKMSDGTGLFDLSPLQDNDVLTKTGFTGASDTLHTYFYGVCAKLQRTSRCSPDDDSAVCQQGADEAWNLGMQTTVTFKYLENTDPFQVALKYSGGTPTDEGGKRAAEVTAVCNQDVDLAANYDGESGTVWDELVYHVTIMSKWACLNHGGGDRGSSSSGLSAGSILTIIFFCLLVTYFIAGAAYMYGRKEKRGIELIPNLDFWKSLPGLIKDGALFVVSPCSNRGSSSGKGGGYESL